MALRILIADDHPIMLRGARMLLEQNADFTVAAQAGSPDALMEALATEPFDLLVTDLNMAGDQANDGLQMIQVLQRRWPGLPLVVLTQQGDRVVLEALLQCGIAALVHKGDALPELVAAVDAAARGERYLSHYVQALLAEAADTPSGQALTLREADVLRLFAAGLTVKDIAGKLHRSVKTVSAHKTSAMAKLGLQTDLDVYNYAHEHVLAP